VSVCVYVRVCVCACVCVCMCVCEHDAQLRDQQTPLLFLGIL